MNHSSDLERVALERYCAKNPGSGLVAKNYTYKELLDMLKPRQKEELKNLLKSRN